MRTPQQVHKRNKGRSRFSSRYPPCRPLELLWFLLFRKVIECGSGSFRFLTGTYRIGMDRFQNSVPLSFQMASRRQVEAHGFAVRTRTIISYRANPAFRRSGCPPAARLRYRECRHCHRRHLRCPARHPGRYLHQPVLPSHPG